MKSKTVAAEMTYRAANLLEENKWGRGQEDHRPGTMCMMQAVEEVEKTTAGDVPFEDFYGAVESKMYDIVGMSGTAWNDREAKDKRDAVRMLRKIGKIFEKEGR